jgi:septal ring factor EnvC (AmiA/AmiB activator)
MVAHPQSGYVPSTRVTKVGTCRGFIESAINGTPMSRVFDSVPRVAMFLAGVAAAALTMPRRERSTADSTALDELKRSLDSLEARIQAREAADSAKFAQIESKIEEHSTKLNDVPSTAQIVAAMEQLLSKTMASLDDRLTTQARSIEVLRTTVTQTDSLLERVLESLDSLQNYPDSAELTDDPLLSRPAV